MKKILVLCAAGALLIGYSGCASTKTAEEKTVEGEAGEETAVSYVMPDDVINGSEGIDDEESSATANYADGQITKWSDDGNKNYLVGSDLYTKVQSNGGDWSRDITADKLSLVDAGDDKIVKLDMGLAEGSSKDFSLLFNISKQAKNKKDLRDCVLTVKFYIPEEMTAEGEASYPVIKLVVRDANWTQFAAGGDLKDLTTKDIGAGWHVLKFDFANQTFECGNKSGVMKIGSLSSVTSVDFDFVGKKLSKTMNVPFYMDWIKFDGMK